MRAVTTFYRPFRYAALIRGMGMGPPLANSNNYAHMTLFDDRAERVTTATVTLTIIRPDTSAATVSNVSVPHVANGVYKLMLAKTACPKTGEGYQAQWKVIDSGVEINFTTDFNVVRS